MNSGQQAALVSWAAPVVGFVLVGLRIFYSPSSYAGSGAGAVIFGYLLALLGMIAGILAFLRSPRLGETISALVGLLLCCLLCLFLFNGGSFAA